MKINRDDPWYPLTPNPSVQFNEPGVTIRLKLAAMAMQGWLASFGPDDPGSESDTAEVARAVASFAYEAAEAMIERANRDEGKAG